MDSISLLDFDRNTQITKSMMNIPLLAPRKLPATSEQGDILVHRKGYRISFENDGKRRRLSGFMNRFSKEDAITFDLLLTDAPKESMVIVTPYKDHPEAFYYNQKINCIRVDGTITLGDREYLTR